MVYFDVSEPSQTMGFYHARKPNTLPSRPAVRREISGVHSYMISGDFYGDFMLMEQQKSWWTG